MQLISSEYKEPLERSRLQPAGSGWNLVAKDEALSHTFWPTLRFRSEDLFLRQGDYVDGILWIRYESDLQRSLRYRSLAAIVRQLRKRRREISQKLSKDAFDRFLKANTQGTRIIRVYDGKTLYRVQPRIVWVKEYDYQWLTKSEFLEERLKDPTTTYADRERFGKAYKFLIEHPESDVDQYKLKTIVKGGHWETRNWSTKSWHWVKRYKWVRIPNRDWSRIRMRWLLYREQVRAEAQRVDEQIQRYVAKRNQYSRFNELVWNQMLQTGQLHALPTRQPVGIRWDGWTGGVSFYPSAGTIGNSSWPTSHSVQGSAYQQSWYGYDPNRDSLPSDNSAAMDLALVIAKTEHASGAIREWREYMGEKVEGPTADSCSATYAKWGREDEPRWEGFYRQALLWKLPDTRTVRLNTDTMRDQRPIMVNLDKDPEGMEKDFWDARLVAVSRLLALNLGKGGDSLAFNFTRSIGELKDTPSTLRTGREFMAFTANSSRREYLVLQRIGNNQAVRYVDPRNARGILERSACDLWRSKGSPAKGVLRSSKLTRRGFQVVAKRVNGLTTIAEFAALYLAWKFGVSQTIADTNTLIHNGWRWCSETRRGLNQLIAHLDTAKRYHPIRRMWSKSEITFPSSKRKSSVLDDVPLPEDKVIADVLELHEHYATLNNPGLRYHLPVEPETGLPVAVSDEGFWYKSPVAFWSQSDEAKAQTYYNAIVAHNKEKLQQIVKAGLTVYYRQQLRGVVFAKYSYETLSKALRDGAKNAAAKFKPFETAWELAPLSFITEWFSNIRSMVDVAQSMIEKTSLKVNPVGKPWECLSSRLWIGSRVVDVTGSVDLTPLSFGTVAHQLRRYNGDLDRGSIEAGIGTVPTRFSIRAKLQYTTPEILGEKVELRKSGIRRCVRRPFLGNLHQMPSFRVKLNLNVGKLGSLLAIGLGKAK